MWVSKHHPECRNIFSALLGVTGTPALCSQLQDEIRAGSCRGWWHIWMEHSGNHSWKFKKQDVLSASEGNEPLLPPHHTIWWLWNFSQSQVNKVLSCLTQHTMPQNTLACSSHSRQKPTVLCNLGFNFAASYPCTSLGWFYEFWCVAA